MKFDRNKVYCQWDGALQNKRVLVASTLKSLREKVEEGSEASEKVRWSEEHSCFVDEDNVKWNFVYLLDRYYVVIGTGELLDEFHWTTTPGDKHVFAEFDDSDAATDWCIQHDKFVPVAKAWLAGKEIQFRSVNMSTWLPATTPCWALEYEYRVKPDFSPLIVENIKIGKIYRNEKLSRTAMCVSIDDTDKSVCFGTFWANEGELADWYEVENE